MKPYQFLSRLQAFLPALGTGAAVVALAIIAFAGCTPQYIVPTTFVSDGHLPQVNTTNAWTVATTQRAEATITVELQYWSLTPLKEIAILQAVTRTQSGVVTRDTSVVSSIPYRAAFSQIKQCDTLLITYTVPTLTRPTGQTIQINPIVRVVSQTGPFKQRAFLTGNGFTWNP